jgi:uncharacterized membrane protein YphA (DoxX/SURF4 family)
MNTNIINLTTRLILGLNVLAASIAHLHLWKFYADDASKIVSWISNLPFAGSIVSIGFLIVSPFILLGLRQTTAMTVSIAFILLNHICLLFSFGPFNPISGPFYNTFFHTVPLVGFALVSMYTSKAQHTAGTAIQSTSSTFAECRLNITMLTSRLLVGSIFLAQGCYILFRGQSVLEFANSLYVHPYENTILPKFLLLFMGIANPFILVTFGLLTTIGLFTRAAAIVLAFFLVSIAFGHLMKDPFETAGDISMYGFNNFAFVILILWLGPKANKYSLDNIIGRLKRTGKNDQT